MAKCGRQLVKRVCFVAKGYRISLFIFRISLQRCANTSHCLIWPYLKLFYELEFFFTTSSWLDGRDCGCLLLNWKVHRKKIEKCGVWVQWVLGHNQYCMELWHFVNNKVPQLSTGCTTSMCNFDFFYKGIHNKNLVKIMSILVSRYKTNNHNHS